MEVISFYLVAVLTGVWNQLRFRVQLLIITKIIALTQLFDPTDYNKLEKSLNYEKSIDM